VLKENHRQPLVELVMLSQTEQLEEQQLQEMRVAKVEQLRVGPAGL